MTKTLSSQFSTSPDGGNWSMTVTKSGYTPVFFTIGATWGNVISLSVENASFSNGKAVFSGAHYARTTITTASAIAWVWWKKN